MLVRMTFSSSDDRRLYSAREADREDRDRDRRLHHLPDLQARVGRGHGEDHAQQQPDDDRPRRRLGLAHRRRHDRLVHLTRLQRERRRSREVACSTCRLWTWTPPGEGRGEASRTGAYCMSARARSPAADVKFAKSAAAGRPSPACRASHSRMPALRAGLPVPAAPPGVTACRCSPARVARCCPSALRRVAAHLARRRWPRRCARPRPRRQDLSGSWTLNPDLSQTPPRGGMEDGTRPTGRVGGGMGGGGAMGGMGGGGDAPAAARWAAARAAGWIPSACAAHARRCAR